MRLSNKHIRKYARMLTMSSVLVGISVLQLFGASNAIATRLSGLDNQQTVAIAKASESEATCVPSADDYTPTHITIAKANIDLPVVTVELNNGTWQVYDGVANYAYETSRVSADEGNVGIYGHDLENAFSGIKQLTDDDLITLRTKNGSIATYAVSSVAIVDPTHVEKFYPTDLPMVTLITCNGTFSEQRYVVKAKQTSLKKGSCNAKAI